MSQSQKKKNVHRSYSFNVGGNPVKVCKNIFLATLGISETYANHAFKNQQDGVYVYAVNMHLITRKQKQLWIGLENTLNPSLW